LAFPSAFPLLNPITKVENSGTVDRYGRKAKAEFGILA
jgi:hypothetical protein